MQVWKVDWLRKLLVHSKPKLPVITPEEQNKMLALLFVTCTRMVHTPVLPMASRRESSIWTAAGNIH